MKKSNQYQSGILLLEVLFSILIFSFGILGLVGLQAVSSQNSANAEDRTLASTLANDMVSQMWLLKTTVINKAPLSDDITAWKTRVSASRLPRATGDVTVDAGVATISIQWKAPSKSGSENSNRYTTQVVVQ